MRTFPVATSDLKLPYCPSVAVGSPLRVATTFRKSQCSERLLPVTTTESLKVAVVSVSVLMSSERPAHSMIVGGGGGRAADWARAASGRACSRCSTARSGSERRREAEGDG